MSSLISALSESEQELLFEDLNYLNMAEIKSFCKKHSIPCAIRVETGHGRRKTADCDRKGVILDRIRAYLRTGVVPEETCYPADVVCFDRISGNLKATDRLFYGQYDKKSDAMVGLLQKLTGGQFKNGAIARILAREFWSKGIAPTFEEYAAEWLRARKNHSRPNPEWAFLSDRAEGNATENWKQIRTQKAKRVLDILKRIGL